MVKVRIGFRVRDRGALHKRGTPLVAAVRVRVRDRVRVRVRLVLAVKLGLRLRLGLRIEALFITEVRH
jgi:hypothetical protein